VIEPWPWRKATWVPCGALGLSLVKAEPLPESPDWVENVQADPDGL